MSDFRVIEIESTPSTNSYAKHESGTDANRPVVFITDNQTAGRGQRGNSWESSPGLNLTFSLVVHPRFISPARQFELSMLVSVGVVNGLRGFVPDPERLKVKWPNDIYYGDRKLAGILIENSLGEATIERSVIGIGINVNQTEFLSDAPNPVSLKMLSGRDADRRTVLDSVVDNILEMIESYESDPEADELTYLYNGLLWRRDGELHTWRDVGQSADFEARLVDVAADGRLVLRTADGQTRRFLFKEVVAVL